MNTRKYQYHSTYVKNPQPCTIQSEEEAFEPFHAKCFFSFRLYVTRLGISHVCAMLVVLSGCSGYWGPWFPAVHMGHFHENGTYHAKCFFSFRLCDTMLRICHISTMVVIPSGCSGFWGSMARMGHMCHFMNMGHSMV